MDYASWLHCLQVLLARCSNRFLLSGGCRILYRLSVLLQSGCLFHFLRSDPSKSSKKCILQFAHRSSFQLRVHLKSFQNEPEMVVSCGFPECDQWNSSRCFWPESETQEIKYEVENAASIVFPVRIWPRPRENAINNESTSFVVPLHHGKAFFWRHLFSPAKLIDIILSTNTKLLTLSPDQNTKPNHKTDLKTNPNPKNSIGPNKPEKKKNGRTLFKSSYCIS